MACKFEKLPLGQYDRRVKLNDAQRNEIKELRMQGLSYAKIAKLYEVSKKLVTMICNPDIAERNRLMFIERNRLMFIERSRDGRYRPSKEEWAAIMREHRAYKRQLYKEGKI